MGFGMLISSSSLFILIKGNIYHFIKILTKKVIKVIISCINLEEL